MKLRLFALAALTLATLALPASADWPGFRGANGLSNISADEAKKIPTDFDGPSGKLVRWKVQVALPGESSPIVIGDNVFVTSADRSKRVLYCYEAATGKLLWEQNVNAGGKLPGEPDEEPPPAGLAASTPASNGKIVVAMFGNGDIAGFNLKGKQLWSRAMGLPESGYGFASSPIVHGDNIIIQYDQGTGATEVESVLFCLDIETGKDRWKTKRPVHSSWTTPIVVTAHGKPQIITVANPLVIGYQLDTGAELWRASCMGNDTAPSAAFANDMVYTALVRNALTAIKTDGKGDVTATHIAWKNEDDMCPEVASPVTDGKVIFLALDRGTLTGHDVATGKKLWEIERDTEFRSSPTLVGDQFWVFDRKGVLHRVSPDGKLLGTADLGDKTDAQPAFSGGNMFIRGRHFLYCIGK